MRKSSYIDPDTRWIRSAICSSLNPSPRCLRYSRPLPVKGEGRAVPVPPPILLQNRRVIAPQQHRPLPGRLHQRGERHLVTVGDLPHHGDGGVHVPLLDLGQHTAGHPRQPGGLVQRQPLLLPEPPGVLRHHCVDLQTFLPSLLTRY